MPEKKEKGRQALLVVDVQQGLFERTIPIYQAEQVLANINTLIGRARKAVAPIIFIQHSNDGTLKKNSREWKLHPAIHPLGGETRIYKLKGNAFLGTPLEEELNKLGVGEVVVCGLVTHGCVKSTTLGALELGYRTVLAGDAHSNFSKDAAKLIAKWNRELGGKGAEILETQDVVFSGL